MAISGIKEILVPDFESEICNEATAMLINRSDEIDVRKENKELRQIVSELKRTMRKLDIRALSAPAIGYDKRIFCIDFKDTDIQTFINPIITQAKGISLSREECTSLPSKKYIRPRNNDIMIMYMTPTGEIKNRQMIGLAAYVFQHEMDHLDGILLSDIGLEIDDQWDTATEEERQEVINAYLDSIDLKKKQLDTEIESNEEAKQLKDAIDFMTSVSKGETILEKDE